MFNVISDILSLPAENHYHDLLTLERDKFTEKIWLNLEIIGDGAQAEAIKRIIQITFEDLYFTNPNKEVYERFEETLKEINLLLNNLKNKNEGQEFCKINAIIAIHEGVNLHLTQCGNAEAYLVRNSKLTVISDGLSGKKKTDTDFFVNIASGEITFNDTVILTSQRLLRFLTNTQIEAIFSQSVPEALTQLQNDLQAESPIAVSCINFKRSIFGNIKNSTNLPQDIQAKEPLQKAKKYFDSFLKIVARKLGKDPQKIEKKSLLIIIGLILAAILLTVILLLSNNRNSEKYTEYQTIITNSIEELKKAERLALVDDKESTNAILKRVQTKVTQILNEGYFRTESIQILDEIKKIEDNVNNIQRISNPKVLANLSNQRNSLSLKGITSLENKLFVFDYNALYETVLDKIEPALKISESESVQTAAAMPEKDLIVFLTESGKVIEYQDNQFVLANTNDDMWKQGVALDTYSKYLYLLAPEDNQIWKYERQKNQYTSAQKYNIDADLSQSIDLAIDGSIFVLNQDGLIFKLYRGNLQNFNIKNITKTDLANVSKIFTLPDQNNLYLLDKIKNSVLVVKKLSNGEGEYQNQIILEDIGQVQDIYVEQNEQKLYAIDQDKIYEIGL